MPVRNRPYTKSKKRTESQQVNLRYNRRRKRKAYQKRKRDNNIPCAMVAGIDRDMELENRKATMGNSISWWGIATKIMSNHKSDKEENKKRRDHHEEKAKSKWSRIVEVLKSHGKEKKT